jgi:hypothetical protein
MSTKNSMSSKSATRSVAFGIAAIILCLVGWFTFWWMPYLGWVAGLVAILFGVMAFRQPVKLLGKDRTMAIVGIVLGGMTILEFIAITVASI